MIGLSLILAVVFLKIISIKADVWNESFTPQSSPLLQFNGHSYYFSKSFKGTFLQADQFCRDVSMRLVNVDSKEENDFLQQRVVTLNSEEHFWTSGTKLIDKTNWIWLSNGELVEYTNWANGQPDFPNTELCLELWWFRNLGLLWNDRDCNAQFSFICERDDTVVGGECNRRQNFGNLFQSDPVTPNIGTLNYNGTSYYVANNFKAKFLDALQFCEAIGMELVSIDSEDVNSRLHKYIRDTNAGDSFWSSGASWIDGFTWIWMSNGQRVKYSNWLPGQPDSKVEYCIQLVHQRNDGLKWNNLGCQSDLFFICQSKQGIKDISTSLCNPNSNPLIGSPSSPTSATPFSDLNVVYLKGKYYYIETEEKRTHNSALQFCRKYDMQLITIDNQEKNTLVNDLLSENGDGSQYWTSGIYKFSNWVWSNGNPMSYTSWLKGKTINKEGYCLQISEGKNTAKWSYDSCEISKPFVCESNLQYTTDQNIKAVTRQERTANDVANANRRSSIWRDGFSKNLHLYSFSNHSYYFSSHYKGTYLQAYSFCKDIGMSLVNVDTKEENDFLRKRVETLNKEEHFWTSGSTLIAKRRWIWLSNGMPVDYTNWANNQPDFPDSELCLELWWFRNQGLLFNDRDCNAQFSFICEKDDLLEDADQERSKNYAALFKRSSLIPNIASLSYNGTDYFVVNTFKATYLQAHHFCDIIDMDLVSIPSEDVNNRLYKYIRDTNAGDSFWSSGTDVVDGFTWLWLAQGRKVQYTNWLAGQPDFKTEHCLQLIHQRNTGMMWNNLGCEGALFFICQSKSQKGFCPIEREGPIGCGQIDSGGNDQTSNAIDKFSNNQTYVPLIDIRTKSNTNDSYNRNGDATSNKDDDTRIKFDDPSEV